MVNDGVLTDVAWFDDEAAGARHSYACAAVDRLRNEQSYREEAGRLAWELYTRKPVPAGGGGGGTYDRVRGPINGIRRAIKTLGAEMRQHKPRPMFLTSDADFDLQDRAKKASRFCDGLYYSVGFDEKIAPLVRLDAMLFGDGFTQWEVGPKSLECERVFALEVVVDEGDMGSDGEPLTYFRERFRDKRLLARDFPKHARDIADAAGASGLSRWWQPNSEGLVRVVQAWRRGYDDGKGGGPKGGRFITCIDGLTLDDGEWPYEWCPIVPYHWSAPVRGYYGESVVEMVIENQRELDFFADIIRRTLRRSVPKIGVPTTSNVTDDQITNEEFAIIRFDGPAPPAGITLVGITPQILQERDYQLSALYDELGLSEMAVSSQMPAGLSMSGRSQLVYEDVKSKRQLEPIDAHQDWYIENARTMLRMIKHAAKGDRAYEVVYRGRDHIERIKFADIDVDEDQYVMKAMPTSNLPSTPSAKYAVLDSWLERGLISVAAYRSMSEMPDLEKENAIENAAREHAQWVTTEILVKGSDFEPHNIMKLDTQLEVGGLMYLDAERRGANEANLGKLRFFLTECRNLWLDQQGIPRPGGPTKPEGAGLAPGSDPAPGGPASGGGEPAPADPLGGAEGVPPGAELLPPNLPTLEAAAAQ